MNRSSYFLHSLSRALCLALIALASHAAAAQPAACKVADSAVREDAVALLATYSPSWTDVKVPVTLNISAPMSIKLSGTAVMTRDSGIHLSLRFFGFEAAALQINGDSIVATSKVNKRYLAENLGSLLHGFPATVGNLQRLLLGQAFAPGSDRASVTDFTILDAADADLPGAFIMMPVADLRGIDCAFVANGGQVPVLMALSAGVGRSQAVCIYSAPESSPAGQVSPSFSISGVVSGKTIDATVTFDLSRAAWNTGVTLPAIKTRGYTRVGASSLLRSLTSF